jgi:hypothetical protein
MDLADAMRGVANGKDAAAVTGRYVSPHLQAQIFPATTPVEEVMLSSQLNAQTHFVVTRTLIDSLRHMQRLVEAHNSQQDVSRVELAAITHPQLDSLGSLRDIHSKGSPRVFANNKFKVFSFCAKYGIDVLQLSSPAFATLRTTRPTGATHVVTDYIPAAWIVEAFNVVKDHHLPTQQWLDKAKEMHPYLQQLPSLAHFIIQRLTHCRDTTGQKKGVNALPQDDPCYCKATGDVKRVVEQAVGVYLQWIKTLGKGDTHIWAELNFFRSAQLRLAGLTPCPLCCHAAFFFCCRGAALHREQPARVRSTRRACLGVQPC